MEGKDAIIERILSDATEKASSLLSSAKSQAQQKIDSVKLWAENYNFAQKQLLDAEVKDIVFRKITVAELDVRKLILKARQDVISTVFDKTYEKLCNLDKKTYLEFVNKLVENYADDNDEIVLSCDGVLSDVDVKTLKVMSVKKLTVAKETGDFIGGIMLVGKVCDKDLSFKRLVDNKKDDISAKIAEALFE